MQEKQEACQLYIEQEIESGLADGKTKYAVGKEIATWIEKLFGAKVKPHTIEQRAHRFEENLLTNVSNGEVLISEKQKTIVEMANKITLAKENKTLDDIETEYDNLIIKEAKKLNAEKAKQKSESKIKEYQEKVLVVKENKIITPPNLILADPPWRYDFSETTGRKIENHYNTENTDNMESHIPETKPDCILLMWATAPKLKEAFELMSLWGFEYKTCAVWDKEKIGMGYWFRGQHELLMVGTKGNVSPPLQPFRVSSVFKEARTQHSKKPECVYKWIEEAFGDKEKLEMYCRTPRPGWQHWGDEV